MPFRETDPPAGFRVTREVPLWGLVVTLVGVAGQAIVLWAQVQSLGDKMTSVVNTQQQTTAQLVEISRTLGQTNLKDLEHDIKIQSITNRIVALEGLYPRQIVNSPLQK